MAGENGPVTAAAHPTPTGAAFDLVLLLHVAAVLVGLGTVAVSGAMARRLAAADGEAPPPAVAAYYAPGVNWAGRVLHAVPVLGVALLAMSRGAYGLSDTWVEWGIGLWVAAALGAEGVLWPAERRVQSLLSAAGEAQELRRECRTLIWAAAALAAVLVAAVIVMVAQP